MDDLVVGRFVIPDEEMDETFSTSGGPGGQHANRSHTAVELRFDVAASSAFPPGEQARIIDQLGDTITVVAADSRSQWRNRAVARRRLAARLLEALQPPPPRRPTRPTRASRARRLESKRLNAEKKRLRKPPDY